MAEFSGINSSHEIHERHERETFVKRGSIGCDCSCEDGEILHKELSYQIVAAGIQVWKTLGYGFLEKVYENAMSLELEKREVKFERQKPLAVYYDDKVIGDYVADMIIEGKIIVELKAGKAIDDAHVAQTLNYLKATNIRLGLILNFGPNSMTFKRVIL